MQMQEHKIKFDSTGTESKVRTTKIPAENWKQHQIQFPKSHMDYQQIHYMQEGEQGLDEPQHCKDRQHQVFYQPEA